MTEDAKAIGTICLIGAWDIPGIKQRMIKFEAPENWKLKQILEFSYKFTDDNFHELLAHIEQENWMLEFRFQQYHYLITAEKNIWKATLICTENKDKSTKANLTCSKPKSRFIPDPESFDHRFWGRTFVISCQGNLDGYSRESAENIIQKFGGILWKRPSVKLDYLLIGDGVNSEVYQEALRFGAEIITAGRFEAMISAQYIRRHCN